MGSSNVQILPFSNVDEAQRLAVLAHLGILDTAPEREFDTIVQSAQRLLNCPIALISFIDETRQWFKARCGVDASEMPRELAFCDPAVAADDALIVPDTAKDARFVDHPLVTGIPFIRFFAGMPIRARISTDDDRRVPLGTLCVVDTIPRQMDFEQIEILRRLAQLVEVLLDSRASLLAIAAIAAERQRALERVDRTDRQFRQAERMANIGSWRLALADRSMTCSDQTYVIHGLPVGDGNHAPLTIGFYPPHERARVNAALKETVETGVPFDYETDFITAQGQHRRIRSMGEIEWQDGIAGAVIGVMQDVTERYAMEQALRRIAFTDELTQLASRARFNQIIDEAIADATPMALFIIDLDHFKSVNDRCGHHTGDRVLRLLASRLHAPYLMDSFAARLGGDEFVVLITSPRLLPDLTGLLQQLLADLRHVVTEDSVTIEASATIGACLFDADIQTRGEFLKRADRALYLAKENLRGSAAIFGGHEIILPKAVGTVPTPR
jgi:diguanylate cyclase (GGDEF)-like protein